MTAPFTLTACSVEIPESLNPFESSKKEPTKTNRSIEITKSDDSEALKSEIENKETNYDDFFDNNPKNLFGKNLSSESERLDRLERAVQQMRHDFDAVRPSIRRLMAIEGDIQTLIRELEQINGTPTSAASAAPTPTAPTMKTTPKPAKSTAQAKPKTYVNKSVPAVTDGKATVFDVRIGEHPGKTRIVMDTNTKTDYTVDIDNNENIMIIDLPNANWTAAMSKSLGKSAFISSYKVELSESGHIAIFQLKKDAKIIYEKDLEGSSGSSRRLVLDLGSS